MKQILLKILAIPLALTFLVYGLLFYYYTPELTLERIRAFAGIWANYPPKDSPAYYWLCTKELFSAFFIHVSFINLILLYACLALIQLCGGRVEAGNIPRRSGVGLCIICLVLAVIGVFQRWSSATQPALWECLTLLVCPFPFFASLIVLTYRHWWSKASEILAIWSASVPLLIDVRHPHLESFLISGAVILLVFLVSKDASLRKSSHHRSA